MIVSAVTVPFSKGSRCASRHIGSRQREPLPAGMPAGKVHLELHIGNSTVSMT
jgi:hypothetical protein